MHKLRTHALHKYLYKHGQGEVGGRWGVKGIVIQYCLTCVFFSSICYLHVITLRVGTLYTDEYNNKSITPSIT